MIDAPLVMSKLYEIKRPKRVNTVEIIADKNIIIYSEFDNFSAI